MEGTKLLGFSGLEIVGIGCAASIVGVLGVGTGLYSVVGVGIIFFLCSCESTKINSFFFAG